MTYRVVSVAFVACAVAMGFSISAAQALTSKECSAKYKAAEAAGTTGGLKYDAYRKAECGTGASATPTAAPAPATTPAATPTPPTMPAAAPTAPSRAAAPKQATTPIVPSNAVFPTAISSKYSTETAGKQRMHTCLDQYNANKANNANGNLKWVQKGGGYYSQCNARLKGV